MTTSTPSNSDQHDNNIFDGSNTAQLHQKKSQEKYIANPDELPLVEEVWTTGTSSTTTANDVVAATGASVPTVDNTTETIQQQQDNIKEYNDDAITVDPNLEEISRVNEAPHDSNINDESSSTSIHNENVSQQQQQQHNTTTTHTIPACESYHQKLTSFGSHSSKNRGVVVRYRYEVVQDLTGMMNDDLNNDTTQQYWTMNSRGERDNIDVYLVESILPDIERKIVDDVMVPLLFDECRNSSSDSKKRVMIRRLSSSDDVIGMDMKPDDFPLPQSGTLLSFSFFLIALKS